jgi:hypothetical protein
MPIALTRFTGAPGIDLRPDGPRPWAFEPGKEVGSSSTVVEGGSAADIGLRADARPAARSQMSSILLRPQRRTCHQKSPGRSQG